MKIEIPALSLVAMVGVTSSGKSTFAAKHFLPTEILSSDFFRAMISDSENDQSVTKEAFALLYSVAETRLKKGKLTVIDATNVQPEARKKGIELAKSQNVHAVAIVLNLPEKELLARNAARPERKYPENVIRKQSAELKRSLRNLRREGFRYVYVLDSADEIANAEIVRTRLWNDHREEHGPFDIIGDIHGCYDELMSLLTKLGYRAEGNDVMAHPDGRRAAFLGDLCDRGPENMAVLRLVMGMVKAGNAVLVPGNHDEKLLKYLCGKKVQMTHGFEKTVQEISAESAEFRDEVRAFLDGLISHYVFDSGRLVISHAGIKQEYIGRSSARIRAFCLYGDTTGETDDHGLPVRLDWAADYRGQATVVYGHTPDIEPKVLNGTVCVDTGCVFGGKLTAYRYPEREFMSIPALRQYEEQAKPLTTAAPDPGEPEDDLLRADDVTGKMLLQTALIPAITVGENNSAAAFEIMSRYAADPHWLIYLPPTMSPCETAKIDDYLEYPEEAFAYYRTRGIRQVVCEKKHMGSRAVIILCQTPKTAARRFGVSDGSRGIIYTRTGRHFFENPETESAILERLDAALTQSGFWEDFSTDLVCLDTELMPWSEKAKVLLQNQYAPVGMAGRCALTAAVNALEDACRTENTAKEVDAHVSGQNADVRALLERYREKQNALESYTEAYRAYCWDVNSVDDFRIAPFHLLACEGHTFSDRTHEWHMETLKRYCTGNDPVFVATEYLTVNTEDSASVSEGIRWWLELTGRGGEGMVVKPETFIARRDGELLQPAVKCRGAEYLRIIYGPEYRMPENLIRLKKRSLSHKRSLALREFALGMESLHRFVRKEPL